VIVYHGTTIENKEGIEREGLRPGSYAARTRELAVEYAQTRGLSRGSDGFVIYELDVPDAAVVEVQSWWWAAGQLLLPFGCPASGIVSIDDCDLRPEPQ
jgi:hypothetical protein